MQRSATATNTIPFSTCSHFSHFSNTHPSGLYESQWSQYVYVSSGGVSILRTIPGSEHPTSA
jgi:hypothetical protein